MRLHNVMSLRKAVSRRNFIMETDDLMDFSSADFEHFATGEKCLNRGGAGYVYGPISLNNSNNYYAIRRVPFAEYRRDAMTMKVQTKKDRWTSLNHINLIKISSVRLKPNEFCILMEYAAGGSLSSTLWKIRQMHQNLPINVVLDWSKQIANGMLYLHERQLLHRDLTPGNILLMELFKFENTRRQVVLKISDFDEMSPHDYTVTGTIAYMAPEVLVEERFSESSDVWSYGVLVWEMLTGKIPHEGLAPGPMIIMASKGELRLPVAESAPKAFRQLVSGCTSNETISRPTYANIMNYFRSNHLAFELLPRNYTSGPTFYCTLPCTDSRKSIRGLTILDEELYIAIDQSSVIEVYESVSLSTLSRVMDLTEKGLHCPLALGSSSLMQYLYILERKFGEDKFPEVLIVNRFGELRFKWQVGLGRHIKRMFITEESNIFLPFHEKGMLIEYSADGRLIRTIQLPPAFYPMHALKLANGRFLLGNRPSNKNKTSVCIVDANGQVEKSIDRNPFTDRQIIHPNYLAATEDGHIMVADQENSRVLLLDSNLTFVRELFTKDKHGLKLLHAILLDEPNNRVFLVDTEQKTSRPLNLHGDGRILIFTFQMEAHTTAQYMMPCLLDFQPYA